MKAKGEFLKERDDMNLAGSAKLTGVPLLLSTRPTAPRPQPARKREEIRCVESFNIKTKLSRSYMTD